MRHPELLCLWGNRALFMGYLPEFGMRRQGAAAICVGLERDLEISTDEREWITCRTALTPPLLNHAIRFSGGYCALLFIDTHAQDLKTLAAANKEQHRNGLYVPLLEEAALLDILQRISGTSSDAGLRELLKELSFGEQPVPTPMPDGGLGRVMAHMLARISENTPVEELAVLAGMSVSNLEHQFRERVGIPLRMFRNWFRLKSVVLSVSKGKNLTDAALAAGFFDSAHFSRAFKETFGLPPSEIFNPRRNLRWFIDTTGPE